MKEIKSNGYENLKKQGFIGDPPDPYLPGGMRESDIPGGGEEHVSRRVPGESDVQWQGKNLVLYYTFNYDHDADRVYTFPISDVKITKAYDLITNQYITDPDTLYSLKEEFEDQIDRDIQEQMENM